jgi:hypothetical protein
VKKEKKNISIKGWKGAGAGDSLYILAVRSRT